MRRGLILFVFLLIPLLVFSQFEQKISVNLSGGLFNTMGAKTYKPDYWTSSEDDQPTQFANYKPGVFTSLGVQYNLNRHVSLQADVGIMYTNKWFFDVYEGMNYTYYAIWDDITDELLAEGHNEFSLLNIGLGLAPRYYLLPGKKVNPFIFAGLTLNITSATYEDNEWQAFHDLDMLEPDDSGPDRAYIENNTGIGFYPGIGLDFSISDNIGFYLTSGFYYFLTSEDNFYTPEQKENFFAITVQGGIKFSFLKSKDI